MGLFDKFKKGNNSGLDVSNPAIKKMVEWIKHPMEFNKEPESAVIFDQRDLFWATNRTEKCSLVKFSVDGEEHIGFTGPITWCFIGVDFSRMTKDQLYETYCGWHIAFATINTPTYDKSQEGSNSEQVKNKLSSAGYSNIETKQNVFIGGNNYYEFGAEKNGKKIKLVGIEDDMHEYELTHVLPFYEYIGIGWNPLDK